MVASDKRSTRDGREVSEDVLAEFAKQASSTAYEAAGQRGAMDHGIRPVAPGMRLCGPALTVRCQPGDNLTLHAAVALARPGAVLVADLASFCEAGHWGEVLTVAAQSRGIAGLVIDGAVRDIAAAERRNFPVFARGVSMKAAVKRVLGTIGDSVTCGGVLVQTGDVVLADEDGVVVIPPDRVQETLAGAIAREANEASVMSRLQNGEFTFDILGFRDVLESQGFQSGPRS